MAILRKVGMPHKCIMSDDKDLYIGSIYQCHFCKTLYVVVGHDDSPIWFKSDRWVTDRPTEKELDDIVIEAIDNYGEEDDLWIKNDDD